MKTLVAILLIIMPFTEVSLKDVYGTWKKADIESAVTPDMFYGMKTADIAQIVLSETNIKVIGIDGSVLNEVKIKYGNITNGEFDAKFVDPHGKVSGGHFKLDGDALYITNVKHQTTLKFIKI